jgi:hypothetical protein
VTCRITSTSPKCTAAGPQSARRNSVITSMPVMFLADVA